MDDLTLQEAGQFAVLRSSSWHAKLAGATQAYWVYAHQVSKVAEAGEYLSLGALMVRGKKNFISIHRLEVGIGFPHSLFIHGICLVFFRFVILPCADGNALHSLYSASRVNHAGFSSLSLNSRPDTGRILFCRLVSPGLLFRCGSGEVASGEGQGEPGDGEQALGVSDVQNDLEDSQDDDPELLLHDPELLLDDSAQLPSPGTSAQAGETRHVTSPKASHAAREADAVWPAETPALSNSSSSSSSNLAHSSTGAASPRPHSLDQHLVEQIREMGVHARRPEAALARQCATPDNRHTQADTQLLISVEGLSEVETRDAHA